MFYQSSCIILLKKEKKEEESIGLAFCEVQVSVVILQIKGG
jgi:hypothetical protein